MGYTTKFIGRFIFNKQLSLNDYKELEEIASKDWRDDKTKPGYHCQWTPSEDGMGLEWDQNEKFYDYIEWLQWLIDNFFFPKGYRLNGEVRWDGEEIGDIGKIIVRDNKVEVKEAKIVFD
jgi:hypothetical protein